MLACVRTLGSALLLSCLLSGCASEREVALELHEGAQATELVADPGLEEALRQGQLDCWLPAAPTAVEALCVQVLGLTADGRITMQATCYDAPGIRRVEDLEAFLRGVGTLAAGLSADPGVSYWIRLLGYSDASRATSTLSLCGISPSIPAHVDEGASPPILPVYLLCPADAAAASVFEDYCMGEVISIFS
jgi:hypothetical protein